MIKYYCDRCGKEAGNLVTVKIPITKLCSGSLQCKTLNVCDECKSEADEIFDMLADIKLSIFAKYLKAVSE